MGSLNWRERKVLPPQFSQSQKSFTISERRSNSQSELSLWNNHVVPSQQAMPSSSILWGRKHVQYDRNQSLTYAVTWKVSIPTTWSTSQPDLYLIWEILQLKFYELPYRRSRRNGMEGQEEMAWKIKKKWHGRSFLPFLSSWTGLSNVHSKWPAPLIF